MIAIAVLLPIAILLVRSARPVLDLPSPLPSIGQAASLTLHISDPRGVRKVEAFVEQNGARFLVWQLAQPSGAAYNTWSFQVGTKTTPQLRDGPAKLIGISQTRHTARQTQRIGRSGT